jgi:hypothetical protein
MRSSPPASPESHLLLLDNGALAVGLLPRAGGRVALFRAKGGANVLWSDPARWAGPAPAVDPASPWTAFNGHIVWVGPQSEWWARQDLAPQKRDTRSGWPPDPWLEYAAAEVVTSGATRAVLRLPVSPVTGLELTKEIELTGPRSARLRVTAVNRRDRPIAWDLWSNTRTSPMGVAYAAVRGGAYPDVRFKSSEAGTSAVPWRVTAGWFHFDSAAAPPAPKGYSAKAFLRPRAGVMAWFGGGRAFIKRATLPPDDRIHPEQAAIEIYCGRGGPETDLLELEMHGPFQTLEPGAAMSFEETWDLLDYDGADTHEARIGFLERRLGDRP